MNKLTTAQLHNGARLQVTTLRLSEAGAGSYPGSLGRLDHLSGSSYSNECYASRAPVPATVEYEGKDSV